MGCLPCLDTPGDPSLRFANSPGSAAGDSSIAQGRRVYFGIFFPEDSPHRPVHMFFDRQKATQKVLDGATAHTGLRVEKGRIVGSPERLNVFTMENEILRLDLEIDAHMHGTLHPSSILILEKGNRISTERLDAIRTAVSENANGGACLVM
jgi:hypothetical protein